ncbi:hypothetical protein FA13DRAFT_1784145 [Coprinellus micaceus]|uniref:NACHT domain-containing protein n=1 Tax=Coprinellus micaceus TaxID=71717 RepID=A0A4Y7R5N0_COPMI|nr:hypothetical protein FA13DRAFT_1784145 [Coprinellus micaceus]
MSTMTQSPGGVSSTAPHEPNTTNVARDYHDHSYHNHRTEITVRYGSRIEPFDRLLEHVAHGAVHDSAERGPDAPKCHPETRVAVQTDIMGWIRHGERDETPRRILWLSGPAGSGKTAIAGTIADECYEGGLLAASFFFSAFAGSRNRRWKKPLIPTLVYRLIQHESIAGLKEEVLAVIERDPMVFERHLGQQLEELVLKPLRKVAGRSKPCHWPAVIIVDGLDECEGDVDSSSGSDAQKEILSALSRACADPTFPFSIIIASRPEPVIRHFFSASASPTLNIFLDDKYDPDSDIGLFLEAMFSDIRRRFNLPSTWASKDVIDILVKEASGQFIYAATVIRFLDDPRLGSPQQLLTRLLEWRKLNDSEPFAPLDLLYTRILRTTPDPLMAARWIRFVDHRRQVFGALHLKYLLESSPGETEHVLGTLTSLVRLAGENGEPKLHFYHKSLLDFLKDPQRSSELHIDEDSLDRFIKGRYYQTLQARGPQSKAANQSTDPSSRSFFVSFSVNLDHYFDLDRRYTSGNVEWWLANLSSGERYVCIPEMFASIHSKCKWHRCLPACGVWRKGILRHCSKHGWRVPTRKEAFHDRFNKIPFYGQEMYPLRPPEVESVPIPTSR